MRLSEIDLNLLVVFEAIYREENLTRAAKKLHLTQPALSHALSRLREMFGDPLFARAGRTMAPTPFARDLIGPVREALGTLERSLFPGRGFEPARTQRRFNVALRELLEARALPVLGARLERDAPGVQLCSVRVPTHDLEAELIAGTLDAAVDIEIPVGPAIRRRLLGEDHFVIVARREHPALRKAPDLETYLGLRHVLVSSRRKGPGLVDAALHRLGRKRRIALRCQSHFAACLAVESSDLVLTMSSHYAELVTQGLDNRLQVLPVEVPPVSVCLYWHAGNEREPASVWLREELVRALETRASTREDRAAQASK
jgi:DNA-binding transcriptional LysR family regulator